MNIRTRKQKGEKENKINFFGEFLKIKKTLWKEIQAIKKIQSDESNTNINYINEVLHGKRLINAVDFTDISDTTLENTDTNDKIPKNLVKEMFGKLWGLVKNTKTENKRFNNQKKIRYNIEHACCLDY